MMWTFKISLLRILLGETADLKEPEKPEKQPDINESKYYQMCVATICKNYI